MPLIESFSGVRGIFGKGLTIEIAIRYAFAYCSWLKEKVGKEPMIVIGTDTRPSSNELKQEMIPVFEKVTDVGIATTPMVELAAREYKADGGIIITASHNEPEWNGFKFLQETGAVLSPAQSGELKKLFYSNIVPKIKRTDVKNKHDDIVKKYVDFILGLFKDDIKKIRGSNIRIVADPNGGAACVVVGKILTKLNIGYTVINQEPGNFKRAIEPNETSLAYLGEKIKKSRAQFAVAFDCDADRAEVVLKDGRVVTGNQLLALAADDFLSREYTTVVVNDATSDIVREVARKHGAQTVEVEVGETNVVEAMETNNSKIGGEGSSSGIILAPSKCRDGIITMMIMLRILANKKKELGELVDKLPQYYTLGTKVECIPEEQIGVRRRLKAYFIDKGHKVQTTGDETGGLKVLTGENSFLFFRASKTEPGIFVIIADATSKEGAERLISEGKYIFDKVKESF